MGKYITRAQSILPQHIISNLMGFLANSRKRWLKNFLIKQFMHQYPVDMSIAQEENPYAYQTFNEFFTRSIKSQLRPIAKGDKEIASPVDGYIAQIGRVSHKELLQAKNFYYTLDSLFAQHPIKKTFYDGSFATLYLAPHNYHRVHMPLSGKLLQTIYVPGRLFSVNRITSEFIPNLYSRNERCITIFETEAGKMAVILIGAMMVGHIKMQWLDQPIRTYQHIELSHNQKNIHLQKGDELGYFNLGSTVILLFEKNKLEWSSELKPQSIIKMGQAMGTFIL